MKGQSESGRGTGRSRATPRKRVAPRKRKQGVADAAAARQAARYSRIRQDHAIEIAEDYVELIAQLTRTHGEARTVEIAERLGVSQVTVAKTINRLQRAGLVRSAPYRSIFLTEAGERLALQSENRHQLIVAFLCKLGVNSADAETDAEGIEHHVSEATLEAMRRFVATDT